MTPPQSRRPFDRERQASIRGAARPRLAELVDRAAHAERAAPTAAPSSFARASMRALQRFIRAEPESSARIFLAPSREARRLARRLGWLFAPAKGEETRLSHAIGALLVAPFTQLTLFSFDLQAFLYLIFHQRAAARIGHFVFMPAVNFFVMAALAQVRFGAHPAAHGDVGLGPNLGTAYAALLLVWYGLLAYRTRMFGWWLVMVPVVIALCAAANLYYGHLFELDPARRTFLSPTPIARNPWIGALASAALVALSHVPEPKLPPRVTGARRWVSMRDYALGVPGERLSATERCARLLNLGVQFISGTLNELVASPRLMPYGFLMRMLELGYRPDVRRQIGAHAERALANGNPAIDYVGTGGAVCLNAEALHSSAWDVHEETQQKGIVE